MNAQVLKDITSGRQEDHGTGQPGKVVGVRTQTYGISSVKRGEGHDQHFVLERDLGREFLICASTARVKLDIQQGLNIQQGKGRMQVLQALGGLAKRCEGRGTG